MTWAGILGVMQHHLQQHHVVGIVTAAATRTCRPACTPTWENSGRASRTRAKRQHRAARIDAQPAFQPRRQEFQQPPGAGAHIQHTPQRPLAEQPQQGLLPPRPPANPVPAFRPSPRPRGGIFPTPRAPAPPARAPHRAGPPPAAGPPHPPALRMSRASAPASPCASTNQALAPSRVRSSNPLSHSSRKWRDSLGWLWPRMSQKSLTQNAPRAASASTRRRVGSAAAASEVSNRSIGLV